MLFIIVKSCRWFGLSQIHTCITLVTNHKIQSYVGSMWKMWKVQKSIKKKIRTIHNSSTQRKQFMHILEEQELNEFIEIKVSEF